MRSCDCVRLRNYQRRHAMSVRTRYSTVCTAYSTRVFLNKNIRSFCALHVCLLKASTFCASQTRNVERHSARRTHNRATDSNHSIPSRLEMLPSLKALRYDRLSTSAISAGSTVADLTPSASDFAFTYAQVKAMYDSKTDSDSAFCRGVRYVRPQEPPNAVPIILKICKLQEQRPADSPNYVTRAEFDAEAAYARRASELDIGPPVYHVSVVESSGEVYGYIAMARPTLAHRRRMGIRGSRDRWPHLPMGQRGTGCTTLLEW